MNIETTIDLWKQWYESKPIQVFLDISRVFLVVLMVCVVIILLRNIEEVKLLGGDPCKLCMNKTGASCIIPPTASQIKAQQEYYDGIAEMDSFDPSVINISSLID